MRNTRAALRYAKAALSTSLEQNNETALAQDMEAIRSVFTENSELLAFLQNPVVNNAAKADTVNKVFPNLNSLSKEVVALLAKKQSHRLVERSSRRLFDSLKATSGQRNSYCYYSSCLDPRSRKNNLGQGKTIVFRRNYYRKHH